MGGWVVWKMEEVDVRGLKGKNLKDFKKLGMRKGNM